ncbi:MAG: hypothetical protein EZS28_003469 [Streblomastix strix]|uniref:Uncharacterized protein n=1 Tax=Streblomastix strix TaxID=222440 RepID=A0A5J4X2N0_9EUKA|nr:MAG: hypothetical protein EZS28_003469 [Streblomastix strix]
MKILTASTKKGNLLVLQESAISTARKIDFGVIVSCFTWSKLFSYIAVGRENGNFVIMNSRVNTKSSFNGISSKAVRAVSWNKRSQLTLGLSVGQMQQFKKDFAINRCKQESYSDHSAVVGYRHNGLNDQD